MKGELLGGAVRISVVIPAFNKEKGIQRAINSVKRQKVKPDEIILVDDGSTDQTLAKAREALEGTETIGLRTIIYTQTNAGVSCARNMGIMKASFPYVAFLDADDEWEPNHIEVLKTLIAQCPDAGLYFTGFKVNRNGVLHYPRLGIQGNYSGYIDDYFRISVRGKTANSSNSCVSRSSINQIDCFPEGVTAGEDLYVWIRLALLGKVACDCQVTSIVHQDDEHVSGKRLSVVPYPLIYFSKHRNQYKRSKSLKYLLRVIAVKHYLFSILKGGVGAVPRWLALFRIDPLFSFFVLPVMMIIPPMWLLSSIRTRV